MFNMAAEGTENTGDTERLQYPWSALPDSVGDLSNVLKKSLGPFRSVLSRRSTR